MAARITGQVLAFRFLAVLGLLPIATTAWAQTGVSGRGAAQGSRTGRPSAQTTVGPAAGGVRAVIQGFEAVQSDTAENQLGVLKLKPSEKGSKLLTLRVVKRPGVVFRVGQNDVDLETIGDFVQKGMYVLVEWEWEPTQGTKKPKVKELKTLQAEIINVEGKVDSVEDGFLNLKVRPVGSDWPDAMVKATRSRSEEAAPAREKRLHVKIHDNLTKYTNKEGKPGELADFEPGAEIAASVVYSRKEGVLLHLFPPGTGIVPPRGSGATGRTPPPPKPTGGRPPGGG